MRSSSSSALLRGETRSIGSLPESGSETRLQSMRMKMIGRMQSMNEEYLTNLIGECVGSLDDIDDGLTELFEALSGDEAKSTPIDEAASSL